MSNRTMVIVRQKEGCLNFRTVSRERKSPHSFDIPLYDLNAVIKSSGITRYAHDGVSFAQFWNDALYNSVHFRFFWLWSDGLRVSGWEQTVILPAQELDCMCTGLMSDRWVCLSLEEARMPKLVFHSNKNLHMAVNEPLVRHKLARFLRGSFRWPTATEILLYDDFEPYSFFFRESQGGRDGICGGVILHGRDDLKTAHYSIHT